jgi:hypothetical protein
MPIMVLMLTLMPAVADKVSAGLDYANDAFLIGSAIGLGIAFWMLLQDA